MDWKRLLAAIALLLPLAAPAGAGWVPIEDFQHGNSFSNGSRVADPLDPSNLVLSWSGQGGRSMRVLGTGQQIADGTVGTLFFQALVPQKGTDLSIGMTDDNSGPSWRDYATQVLFLPDEIAARDGDGSGGGPTPTIIEPITALAWYDFWMAVDHAANHYDVYAAGPGIVGTELLADDFGFRRTTNPGALDVINLLEGGLGQGPVYFDNFLVDTAGRNLTKPVPEPATVMLLGSGLAALLRRRRR
ncbi:MAG: PEP-CTERM sorting domain-containing protein [Candidatus Brocadiia bacterium]